MPSPAESSPTAAAPRVFLNVPYDASYEKILVALTAALIALGRDPQLTFQVPDGGQGRLRRIFDLLSSCPVSIHDLSAVGTPVRFNMPFELGLACALKEQTRSHDFLVLERKRHRLDRSLTDLKGIDPKIHGGSARAAIAAILEVLERSSGNPTAEQVWQLYRRLHRLLPALKRQHGRNTLFGSRVYGDLVSLGWIEAQMLGLVDA